MCNLSEGIWERAEAAGRAAGLAAGRAAGEEKTFLAGVKALMETMNLTVQQAMDALKVPDNFRERIVSQLS